MTEREKMLAGELYGGLRGWRLPLVDMLIGI